MAETRNRARRTLGLVAGWIAAVGFLTAMGAGWFDGAGESLLSDHPPVTRAGAGPIRADAPPGACPVSGAVLPGSGPGAAAGPEGGSGGAAHDEASCGEDGGSGCEKEPAGHVCPTDD